MLVEQMLDKLLSESEDAVVLIMKNGTVQEVTQILREKAVKIDGSNPTIDKKLIGSYVHNPKGKNVIILQ